MVYMVIWLYGKWLDLFGFSHFCLVTVKILKKPVDSQRESAGFLIEG